MNDFQIEGGYGKSLAQCREFCMKNSPRKANGLISTSYIEYHSDTYCGCFARCDFSRHPDAFRSTADIYHFDSPDVNSTSRDIPNMERYENNPCLNKVCKYSDPKTWGDSGVPTNKDTQLIYVPEKVTLELDQDVDIRFWVIEGSVIAAENGRSLTMGAEGIFVNGGTLRVGSPEKPFLACLNLTVNGYDG